MRELTLKLAPGDRPAYLRIGEAVRTAIREGRARPGEPLPSTRALAPAFGVHRHTVMAAFDELVAEGWLEARRGAAYRVSRTLPTGYFSPRRSRACERPKKPFTWTLAREVPERPSPTLIDPKYEFRSGLADLRLFPYRELQSHLADVLRRPPRGILGYTGPEGHERFLRSLAVYLRRMRALEPGGLLVTHGSQEAIFLAGQLLVSPGDTVAVEALGYQPAWDALRAAGARLEPVALDAHGLLPDAFGALCARRRVRLLYTTPLHQYPSTVTLPAARRLAIYELAVRHGVAILEDDYDHEYHYRCHPLPPLASEDPAGLVLYASTFSKVLYPSARLGYLAVPAALVAPMTRLRRIVTRQNDGLLQEAVARWMESGGLERHMRRMRRAYEERRDAMVAVLQKARARGLEVGWSVPDGGMALWLRIPWVSSKAAEAAARAGVFVQPEETCQLSPGPGHHLRLGYAACTPEEISAGLAALFNACSALSASHAVAGPRRL